MQTMQGRRSSADHPQTEDRPGGQPPPRLRPGDKPLDGFDKLPFDKLRVCDTAGTLGALTHSTLPRVILRHLSRSEVKEEVEGLRDVGAY
jgi:hypothetical protein